ncbi:MAG TPA: hypothetical protein VGI22_26530, partial [Xanthobacteraceae bacterium]
MCERFSTSSIGGQFAQCSDGRTSVVVKPAKEQAGNAEIDALADRFVAHYFPCVLPSTEGDHMTTEDLRA